MLQWWCPGCRSWGANRSVFTMRWERSRGARYVTICPHQHVSADLMLPARCWVRTQDVQCAVIHSLSEILPVYEVLTIMQDIGYWKHELLGCKIYGRYKWVHPLHRCAAIWMVNTEPFIILYCMWRKYIEDCPRKYLMLKKFLTENSNVTV